MLNDPKRPVAAAIAGALAPQSSAGRRSPAGDLLQLPAASGPTGLRSSRPSRRIPGLRSPRTTRTPGRPCPSSSPRRTARWRTSPTTASPSASRPRTPAWWRLQARAFRRDPGGLKDPDGYWFTIHSGTLGLFVNKGRPRRQAGAAVLGGPPEAGIQGHGRAILIRPAHSSATPARWRSTGDGRRFDELRSGHRILQETQEEPPDRSQADLVCPGALRRDPDPVRLRLQRLSGDIQGQCQRRLRHSGGGHRRGALRDEPGEKRAPSGQGQEGARLHHVRQGAGGVGQRLPAAGARQRHVAGGRGQVPACLGVRARHHRSTTRAWRRLKRASRPLSGRSALNDGHTPRSAQQGDAVDWSCAPGAVPRDRVRLLPAADGAPDRCRRQRAGMAEYLTSR